MPSARPSRAAGWSATAVYALLTLNGGTVLTLLADQVGSGVPCRVMAWQYEILVVANVTADSAELTEALRERAARDRCHFTLLVPAPGAGSEGREAAERRIAAATEHMRAAGLEVEGVVGDHDALAAVRDAWDPRTYDEIVVSTLPTGSSKWLQVDLPHRVEQVTDAPVRHVVAQPARPEPETHHREPPESLGLLSPLRAVTGGRRTPVGPGHLTRCRSPSTTPFGLNWCGRSRCIS